MKDIANEFSKTIKQDTVTMRNIENQQDWHLKDTEKEDKRVKKMEQKARMGFCMWILTLLFAFVLFFFMMALIRLFPLSVAYPVNN